MNCRQVQDRLLEAEDPRPDSCGATAIAGHLKSCDACRAFADRLVELEEAWRSLPEAAAAERAKAAFLERLDARAAPITPPPRPISRRRALRWCATAAASLLAAGAGAWLLLTQREARAADDLLDRLVDWNLRLTQAQSEAERSRLYHEQAERLRSALDGANLAADQAALAEDFWRNGAWLVAHCDAVAEADRFDSLADRLLQLARAAGTGGNHRRMNRLLRQYNRVLEAGVDLNVERAEALGTLDFEHQRKLERLALRDADRVQQLASLLEATPDASRKEIQRALRLHVKRAENPGRAKHPRRSGEAKQGQDAKEE